MTAISFSEVFAAINASLAVISFGLIQGFGGISLASLDLDDDQVSWFASIDSLMAIIFTPIGGKIAEVIGIKKTFLLCSPMITLGWILVGTFASTFWLFVGRVLSGIGVSIMMASPSVYIAETAHPDHRATLISMVGFSYSLGICLLWFLGYFFAWQTVAYLSTVPPILNFIGFLLLPDAPFWLVQHRKFEEAFTALKYFRRNYEDERVIDEFNEILEHYQQKLKLSHYDKVKIMCSRAFIKPFLCIGILYPLYEFSGTMVTTNYLQSLMIESKIELEPRTCSLILGLIRICASVIILITIQKLQPLFSYVGLASIKAIALLVIGAFFYVQSHHPDIATWTWIPFAMVCLVYIPHTFLISIHWILVGEMFPSELRNVAAGFIESITFTFTFVVLKLYVAMKHSFGLPGVFFFYASFAAISSIYAALTIPDNRGKSLIEIENNCKTPLISKQ